ncbi:MAG: M20 family metallopeptidase [Lachnospiraceae bacterium]|nr:M20 family metallopeptidase [Lachnospiraceae bacterium]
MDEAKKLLISLLSIPSVNGRDDEGKVAEFLCEYLKEAGLKAEVDRIDETHANVRAVLRGKKEERRILWNGHLDTVPYGALEEWESDPALPVERDGRIFARGASDMKSGLAAMVFALAEFAKSGRQPENTIHFLGSADEEKGGLGAIKAVERDKEAWDEILIGEPTGLKMGVVQKGGVWLCLRCFGKTSHGAYPEEGVSAVKYGLKIAEEVARFVGNFSHPLLGVSTAQVNEIRGGIAPNMTPDYCELVVDVRLTPGISGGELIRKTEEIISTLREETAGLFRAELSVDINRRGIEISGDALLYKRLGEVLRHEGVSQEEIGIRYFTDASVLAENTLGTEIMLFGPGEPSLAHKPNEWVELQKYGTAIRVFSRLLEAEA